MQKSILKITYAGLLIALSVVLTRFLNMPIQIAGIQGARLNLGFIPIILAGMLLGPLYGGIVGSVADILGYLINPMGAVFFPGFTLTSATVGVLPILISYKFKKKLFFMVVSILITVITATILNTIWLSILYHLEFKIIIIPRLIIGLIMFPIYTFFVVYLKKIIDKTLISNDSLY